MRVKILAGDLGTSLNARIKPLCTYLKQRNIDCQVILPIDWRAIVKRFSKVANILSVLLTFPPEKLINLLLNDDFDVLIVNRISTHLISLVLKRLKRKTKIVFDLNDALFLKMSKFLGINMRPGSFALERIIIDSDFVTVNGHFLLGYVSIFNNNADIIHDPIDTELFSPAHKKKTDIITIGWEGNARVHYENLKMLVNPLRKLAKKYDLRFKIVSYLGDRRIKCLFKKLEKLMKIDYGSATWLPPDKHAELIYDFDIEVAPLKKSLWNEGKSALRVGIGMAMGIPVVASPVGEQKYVIKHGDNGFLAKNDDDWYRYLKLLIEDDELRKLMGKKGRETAEKVLSLRANGAKLYKILQTLLS